MAESTLDEGDEAESAEVTINQGESYGTEINETLFQSLGKTLCDHNYCVKYNAREEYIQVTLHEGILLKIQPTFDVEIYVHEKRIPIDHEIWTSIPTKLDTEQNVKSMTAVILKLVEKWHVCNVTKQGQIAEKYQKEFSADISGCDCDDCDFMIDPLACKSEI